MDAKKTLALAVAAALSHAVSAETSSDETLVVTANRVAQPLSSVINPITVVTQRDIATSPAQDLAELLSRQPGIAVSRSGGKGQVESIFIRGTSSAQSLILLDGVRLNLATTGGAQLGSLPLTFVERIEIIRGARASVYGADAMGGVINVITKPQQASQGGRLEASAGSNHSWTGAAKSTMSVAEHTQLTLGLSAERSDGYDFRPEDSLNEDYGYSAKTGMARLDHHFSSAWRGELSVLHHNGDAEYIHAQNVKDEREGENTLLAAKLYFDQGSWFSQVVVDHARLDSKGLSYDLTSNEVYQTKRSAANALLGYRFSEYWQGVVGIDYQQDDIGGSTNDYLESKRDNKAVYIGASGNYDMHLLELSLRHDDNQRYGDNTTYNLAWEWQVHPILALSAQHGTAFRAPSFNDLYFPGSGNPNLKAETSQNNELGAVLDLERSQWQLSAYQNDIDDLIAWACAINCSNGYEGPFESWPIWLPSNVDKARIRGMELQGDFSTAWLNHRVIYEYLDARDKKSDKYLVRRPKHQFKYRLDAGWQQWTFVIDYLWRDSSFDDTANAVRLDAYQRWDLGTHYHFRSGFDVSAALRNALDKDYSTQEGYQAEGRSFELSVRYAF